MIKNIPTILTALTLGLFMLLFQSGCTSAPSKEEATKMLRGSAEFNKQFLPSYYSLYVVEYNECKEDTPGISKSGIYDQMINSVSVLEQLSSSGYITLDKTETPTNCLGGRGGSRKGKVIRVSLTEKGKQVFTEEKDSQWKTPLCKDVFGAVEAVSKYAKGPNTIVYKVEYTKTLECSELAKALVPVKYELERLSNFEDHSMRLPDNINNNSPSRSDASLIKSNGQWTVELSRSRGSVNRIRDLQSL